MSPARSPRARPTGRRAPSPPPQDRLELARLGGLGKSARLMADQRALLEAVLPDHLTLASEEDAKHLLALSTDLTFRGYLTGTQAGAISKTIDIWLRAEAQRLDRNALVAAQSEIARLRAEVRTLKQGRRRAPDAPLGAGED